MDYEPQDREGLASPVTGVDEALARGLTGDMRCIRCGYNQRGLSVRAACPECGTPVLATILAVIDPQAHELQPISRPRVLAAAMLVWAIGAVAAAAVCWSQRLIELLYLAGMRFAWPGWLVQVESGLVVVSMAGAAFLVRPHGGIGRRNMLAAMSAVACYPMLVLTLGMFGAGVSGYLTGEGASVERACWRLLAAGWMALIILGLRPNLRVLAARSRVVRSGRVDRQSMLAMVGALGIAAVGDVIRIATDPFGGVVDDAGSLVHAFMVGVGSALFTLGLVGILRDVLRLLPVIVQPALGVGQVFDVGTPRAAGASADAK